MKEINYFIVDVFSQGKYTGNQLAVFENAENLTDFEMQQIAKEINYSETTFILPSTKKDSDYHIRIFTPNEEIPFAGHPILGTASIIQNELLETPLEQLVFSVKGGDIPVSFDHQAEVIWMKQNAPMFGKVLDSSTVTEILTVDKEQLDTRFPVQEVSTGLPVIIVPLKSLEAVQQVKINKEKYFNLIKNTEAKAIMVFSPETYHVENDLNARDFAEYYGIPEDAATGSSNGCLASYLVKYEYFGKRQINIRVEQGYEMERPSLLFAKAENHEGEINVRVGGRVVKVAQGKWFV